MNYYWKDSFRTRTGCSGRFGLFCGIILCCLIPTQRVFARALFTRVGKILRVANERAAAVFNTDSGECEILTGDGSVLCSGLKCLWGNGTNNTLSVGTFSYGFMRIHQSLGSGTRMEVACGTNDPLHLMLTIFDNLPLVLVQIRAPLASGITNIPISFEALAFPTIDWNQKSLGLFQAEPEWAGKSHWLDKIDASAPCSSAGLICFNDERKGRTEMFSATKDLAKVRLNVQLPPMNDLRGLKLSIRWLQNLQASEKYPQEWESDPLIFASPLSDSQAAALLRRAIEMYGGGSTQPADAVEQLRPPE